MTIKHLLFLLTLTPSLAMHSQCIDPNLIDPNAICPLIWDPVCGCDGVTYSNSCEAINYGGVTDWTPGMCSTGGDCLDLAGLDFGFCDMVLGVALVDGQCTTLSGCGWTASDGVDYSPYFFDNFSDCESLCGGGSDCIDPEQINITIFCIDLYEPVCGCNGVTYTNECWAYYHGGVTSWTAGECGSQDCVDSSQVDLTAICPDVWIPVCGCNGITYSNECEATNYGGITSWTQGVCGSAGQCLDVGNVDFGPCDFVLGITYVNGVCQTVSGCSFVVNGINYEPYFFDSEEACTAACEEYSAVCDNPNTVDPNYPCTEEFDPVCGCDFITYSNACMAFYQGGITAWTPGECGNSINEVNARTLSIYPNPTDGMVELTFPLVNTWEVTVTDGSGRLCRSAVFSGRQGIMNLEGLSSGIYIISARNSAIVIQSRLVVN